MRRHVVGTAGHVDHGKTSIVRALTGIDTDRLPEEKRRGMSIELGFAPFALDAGMEVSIVDMPGHRDLVHTMISGATGVELMLLVVAADEGVMPQTIEHLQVAELLGKREIVVALTKIDRVDRETIGLAHGEVAALLSGRFDGPIVPCSPRTGEGVDELRTALRHAVGRLPSPSIDGPAALSIDRIFNRQGAGVIVTGTLTRGRISAGDSLFLYDRADCLTVNVRGLEVHGARASSVYAPARVGLNLNGKGAERAARGASLSSVDDVPVTHTIDAALRLLRPLCCTEELTFYVGATKRRARVGTTVATEPCATFARLHLEEPVALSGGDRFLLRGSRANASLGAVAGGGTVVDARPDRRTLRSREPLLRALGRGDEREGLRHLLEESAPCSIKSEGLARRFMLGNQMLRAAERRLGDRDIVKTSSGYVSRSTLQGLAGQARAMLLGHYAEKRHEPGISLETLRTKLGAKAGMDVATEALKDGIHLGLFAAEGAWIIIPEIAHRLRANLAHDVRRVLEHIQMAEAHGRSEPFLRKEVGMKSDEVAAICMDLQRRGYVRRLGDLWFDAAVISRMRDLLVQNYGTGSPFNVADFKARSRLPRRQAILMLEHFDAKGLTKRTGDIRQVRCSTG